jgi:serine/threonine protein kinase
MTTWWPDERIRSTVNAPYVTQILQSEEHQATLHRPLAFGDGLTDHTYLDWILERCQRIFLILNRIGAPESIFAVIDKTIDDDDLPISVAALGELNLFPGKSETMELRFYRQQYYFLIRELQPGGHVEYGNDDIVPLEQITRRHANGSGGPQGDRVFVSNRVYARRKISTSGAHGIDRKHFVMHTKRLQGLAHPHLVAIWATYSQNTVSYALLHPTTDHTLKAFLDEEPKAFKQLEKLDRRKVLLRWTHCLTSALAYLHDKGFTHQAIRPSAISVDHEFRVYLGDFGALKALDPDENAPRHNGEQYDYAAPENWKRKPCLHEATPLRTTLPGGGRTTRRLPPDPARWPPRITARTGELPRRTSGASSASSFSEHSRSLKALVTTLTPASPDSPPSCPADVFSLTACLLQILSMIVGRSPKSFASHRSRHHRHAGRGGAPADSSFHVNLPKVWTWMDLLGREASERHRKDGKSGKEGIWGAVIWIVEACRGGMQKEAGDRIDSREMEREVRTWVDKALGRVRRQCCGQEEEERDEADGWMDMGLGPRRKRSSGELENATATLVNDESRSFVDVRASGKIQDDDDTRPISFTSTAVTDATMPFPDVSAIGDVGMGIQELKGLQPGTFHHFGTPSLPEMDSESLGEDMRRFGILRMDDNWPLRTVI